MNIEDYLRKLRTLKDRKVVVDFEDEKREISTLTAELGLYDNYSVLLNGDFNRVAEFFRKRKYQVEMSGDDFATIEHPKPIGYMDLSRGLDHANFAYLDEDFGLDSKEIAILGKIRRDYNMSLMIHPNLDKMDISREKACALMAIDIIGCVRSEQMPACFLNSMGWRNQKDFSRIIYYEPNQGVKR